MNTETDLRDSASTAKAAIVYSSKAPYFAKGQFPWVEPTLLKNDGNIYLWMPLILAACFYLMVFHAQSRRERPQQVVELLDYAVRHAEAKSDFSPKAQHLEGESAANQSSSRSANGRIVGQAVIG